MRKLKFGMHLKIDTAFLFAMALLMTIIAIRKSESIAKEKAKPELIHADGHLYQLKEGYLYHSKSCDCSDDSIPLDQTCIM